MNINTIFKKCLILTSVYGLTVLSSTQANAGPDALLGIQVTDPMINSKTLSFKGDAGTAYDGANFTIQATPFAMTFSNGQVISDGIDINTSNLLLTAPINSSGALSTGGSFVIYGVVTDAATGTVYEGRASDANPLLTGTVDDYGISNTSTVSGGVDQADFKLTVTGGLLATVYSDATTQGASAAVILENSTFDGDFAGDWTASTTKIDVGIVPDIPPLDAHTIGYWKNHDWPVSNLVICGTSYLRDALIDVLKTPTRKIKTLIMAKQLIAAKLNEYGGNECPAIVNAEAWLCGAETGGGLLGSQKEWTGGEALKDSLDNFNNGNGCI